MKKTIPLALLAATLAAALASAPAPAAAQSNVVTHEVALHEFGSGAMHIQPDVINAQVGQTLKLLVTNPEGNTAPHNLVVCGDPPHSGAECDDVWAFLPNVPAGETREMTFAVEKAGEFEYFCQVLGHKDATPGMKGKLVVQGGAETKESPGAAALGALAALAVAALVLGRR